MAVDAKARSVEEQIDNGYRQLPFLRRSRTDALCHALIAADMLLGVGEHLPSRQDRAIRLDMIVNILRPAVAWISATDSGRTPTPITSTDVIAEAREFLDEAWNYLMISAAYTYASRDVIELSLVGQSLHSERLNLQATRYEAYNLLLKPTLEDRAWPAQVNDDKIIAAVKHAAGKHITPTQIPLARSVLSAAYETLQPASDPFYELPPEWSFGVFSLAQFRQIHDVLRAVVYVWKRIAPLLPVTNIPYVADLPYVVPPHEVLLAVKDITGLAKATITRVIEILTYGEAGINNPDPALQPLIRLPSGSFVLSGLLFLGTAAERNLAALINQLPAERSTYSSLTIQKEQIMYERIVRRLPPNMTAWSGKIPGRPELGNVDLGIVDISSKCLLLLELKWFIDPAEPRELDDRSEELTKGIAQCKRLLSAIEAEPSLLRHLTACEIKHYATVVVSANWIGLGNVQDLVVPIVNEDHLTAKMSASDSLASVMLWLRNREYLPVEGVDFRTSSETATFGGFTLEWYGLEALEKNDYFPL
jgi:hypothetical protein